MDTSVLKDILSRFQSCKVGVLGDYCLDAYWTLSEGEREISVETGKPTHGATSQRYSLGGAGNIVANLAAMNVGQVKAFAVIGDDIFGREMINQLTTLNVDCSGILIQHEQWDTPVYAKPYLNDEELERIDFGQFNMIEQKTESIMISTLERCISDLDILIVNQQLRQSIYSEAIIGCLNRLAESSVECEFLLDARNISNRFHSVIVKLNASEAAKWSGFKRDIERAISVEDLGKYAAGFFEITGKPVIITRGSRGIMLYDGKDSRCISGIQMLKKVDPVGAGDTICATVAASLAAGVSLYEAVEIANLAAGVTVQKLKQTGTVTPHEILEMGTDTDYLHNPELAEDIRKARYLNDSLIEIINDAIVTGEIRHALFDHDGTISTLREGWESIMEPVMIKAILGNHLNSCEEDEYKKVVSNVRAYIDQSTGIQTILQMQALAEMVREAGYVPSEEVLDAHGYKKIYNDALMELINDRKQRVIDGELDVVDYTIKGAVDLLHQLHARGVKLYLASGTDEEDVKLEAELLGYADLFEGRIFGAVGDVSKYSKKMVVDRIIEENNLSGSQLVCFGDGPVEIRETKKRDGITVGIASHEVRRFGLNSEKRTRLIRAGSDIIIPDFSQRDILIKYLFEKEPGAENITIKEKQYAT